MPYVRPSLSELTQRIQTDLATRILGTPNVLRRAVVAVIGTVMAGAVHLAYGYIAWLTNQVFPDTAESTNLYRWAAIWGLSLKPATYNTGNVLLTGVPGSILSAGDNSVFTRADGTLYSLDADVIFPAGTTPTVQASGSVTAQDPGSAPACDPGTILTLQSSSAGISPSATVDTNGIEGGFDVEADDSLLARLKYRIANPSRGGNDADYVVWATANPGVTRAWPLPKYLGLGTVGVIMVYDGQTPSIIPTTAEIASVQANINTLKPSHADVTVFAPAAVPLNPVIHLNPDSAAARAAIQIELQDLLTTEGEPDGTVYLSHIRERIGNADGVNDYTLVSPTADQTYTQVQVPILGTITWQ